MHVVAHQRPGMDRAFGLGRAPTKQREIREAVAGQEKQRQIAAALHHVQRACASSGRRGRGMAKAPPRSTPPARRR